MLYSDNIPIRKDWVAKNQASYLIEDTHATISIGDGIRASAVKGEEEFDLISVSLTDEVDPLFLSTPIPNGVAVIAFYSDSLDSVGFYDSVLDRFQKGSRVTVSVGYRNGEFDSVTWSGYAVTNAVMNARERQVTVEFEHIISFLSQEALFPVWGAKGRNVSSVVLTRHAFGILSVARQLSDSHPELNLGGLVYTSPFYNMLASSFDTTNTYLYTHSADSVLTALTHLQNTTPFSLVEDHNGTLTSYQGGRGSAQDVRVWSSEVFHGSIDKENFDVGVRKQAKARPQTLPLESTVIRYSDEATELTRFGYDGDSTVFENLNFHPLEDTTGIRLAEPIVRGAVPVDDNGNRICKVMSQTIQCCSDVGGRVVYVPPIRNRDYYNSLDPEDTLAFRDVEVVYGNVLDESSDVNTSNVEVIDNPFGANINACYTYPKENYKFKLVGEMRDNPSFKPNQVVYIPYGETWAEVLLTSLTRTFTGGSRLKFEGVVVNITDVPVWEFEINEVVGRLIPARATDDDVGYNVQFDLDVMISEPPLTQPTVYTAITLTIPNRNPVTISSDIYSSRLSTNIGFVSYADWSGATATVDITYGIYTKTADVTLAPWVAAIPDMPRSGHTRAGEPTAMAILPTK